MDLIHKLMNVLLPPMSFIAFLFVFPFYLAFKFVSYIQRHLFTENVAGKVVIVTGAASGIGEQMAYEYAKRAASLVLVDITEDRLGEVVDRARRFGSPNVIAVTADVSVEEDCKRFVDAAVNHFGKLDHLVNNAGIARQCWFTNVDYLSKYTPIMDINFWGTVYGTHYAIPHLRKSKGKVIVISSTCGWYPLPKLSFYNASKAAVISFYESLRTELGGDIGITIVTPGLIKSELTQSAHIPKEMHLIPMETKEECAKAIVESACRGDKYLVEPSWVRSLVLWKAFCPELTEYCTRLVLGTFGRRNTTGKSSLTQSTAHKAE